jgi:hypothetical protein
MDDLIESHQRLNLLLRLSIHLTFVSTGLTLQDSYRILLFIWHICSYESKDLYKFFVRSKSYTSTLVHAQNVQI